MPFWDRAKLGERLIYLRGDVIATSGALSRLADLADGSPESHSDPGWMRQAAVLLTYGQSEELPGYQLQIEDLYRRIDRSGEDVLKEARRLAWAVHLEARSVMERLIGWTPQAEDIGTVARAANAQAALASDEALRVYTAAGDVRRNERRAG